MDILFRPEWNGRFHSGRNEAFNSGQFEMGHSVPARMKWAILFRPEWNGPFRSSRIKMGLFILAGMERAISFWPEWNGPFHSGRNGTGHLIPAWVNQYIITGDEYERRMDPCSDPEFELHNHIDYARQSCFSALGL